LFAAAIGEGAVVPDRGSGRDLHRGIVRQMVRRLVEANDNRARLFDTDGTLLADSRRLLGPGGMVQIEELPPPRDEDGLIGSAFDIYDRLMARLTGSEPMAPYRENPVQRAADYAEASSALTGEGMAVVRSLPRGGMILNVAVPVQRYKQVLGVLMLSRGSQDIDEAVLQVRVDILEVFAVALAVTVALSMYLAGTIARPIRRLADAAERVRHGLGRRHFIPDFAGRGDEIGDLALSLKDMTEALWRRMDAIEAFAADVAHEIKNPLTSLRSAVETAARVKDADQQQQLMTIIQEDVLRLDRLISDISDASRLDAELSRAEQAPVDIGAMLATLVEISQDSAAEGVLTLQCGDGLVVNGMDSRLAQVFRNLIANAFSFSPAGGGVAITASGDPDSVFVTIDDEGPGIPEGKEEAIFERFYSERPEGEKFGTHSGLGLSISKQIIEAHGGTVIAETRHDGDGRATGARFSVRLPRL
jgi:two-component system sensor histidine kinase ChvG